MHNLRIALASLVFTALACQSVQAKRIAQQRPPHAVAPVVSAVESPMGVTLVGENGRELDTYTHRGRFYVHGQPGERYSIRVSNPTDRRVEAVVAVDGLDVIDGETASFRSKRGYIVPARGSVTIDGFRVSTEAVAAFRFSSVRNSYAGRKGKARHVGVVGVAFFDEKVPPIIALPVRPSSRPSWRARIEEKGSTGSAAPRGEAERTDDSPRFRPVPPTSAGSAAADSSSRSRITPPRQERRGLGTAFGEHRNSSVRFTKFQRATPNRPSSIAELRYNNSAGLRALGIRLRPVGIVGEDELAIRESATPFPHSPFAKPPQ